jgi:transposase InsO family protein
LHTRSPKEDVGKLCGLFGRSRQAYYQRLKYNYKEVIKAEILLQMISKEREMMPRIGGRKLLHKLQPRLPEELSMGRDKFFQFLGEYNLLVRRKRYRARTTNSSHWLRKYPNLVKEFTPNGPHQLWVSDITYIETAQGFVYLFLITDAYSRKVIGWSVGQSLEADHAVLALYMALSQLPAGKSEVFHHSDRGVQYCSEKYVKILNKNGFQISMTENGDPLENAIAERVNGILKQEWLNDMKFKTKNEVSEQVKRVIDIYNNERPHSSIGMLTPNNAHLTNGELQRLWKNYYKQNDKVEINV